MDSHQKAKDLSFLLPFVGLLLLSPLVLAVAYAKESVFGLPSLPLFIFVVWLLLIVCSFLLTRKLKTDPNSGSPDRGPFDDSQDFDIKTGLETDLK